MMATRPARSKARTWSALGIGVAILGIWWLGPWAMQALMALVAGGACWEVYLRLRWPGNLGAWHSGAGIAGFAGLGMVALFPTMPCGWVWASVAFVPGWWALHALLMHQGPRHWGRELALAIALLFYAVFPMVIFRDLVTQETSLLGGMKGSEVFMATFGLLWLLDSGALLVGKRWGRHPLHSRISPSKTLEGSLGGWALCILAGWILYPLIFGIEPTQGWGWFSLLAGPVGIAGDLMQSALKRNAGVKDSGSWIPGHGGWLDRFDSLLALAALLGLWVGLGR